MPMIALVLFRLSGIKTGDFYMLVVFMEITIALGFLATALSYANRYIYFAVGLLTFIPPLKIILDSSGADDKYAKAYRTFKWLTLISWVIYPIVWILGTGANVICVNSEIMAYCVLDVLSKVFFSLFMICYADVLPALELNDILPLPDQIGTLTGNLFQIKGGASSTL